MSLFEFEGGDGFCGSNVAAVAKDGDGVGDCEDFLELVGHIENTNAASAQRANGIQQSIGLPERNRRGRLIEKQNSRVDAQRPRDLDQLLLGGTEYVNARIGRKRQADHIHIRTGVALDCGMIDPLQRPTEDAMDENVFGHRERRDQASFLVDDGNAAVESLVGRAHRNRLARQSVAALIGLVDAGDNLDERRFPGTVLPDQCVHFSRPQGQAHIVECLHAGKSLADIGQLEQRASKPPLHGHGASPPDAASASLRCAPSSRRLALSALIRSMPPAARIIRPEKNWVQ